MLYYLFDVIPKIQAFSKKLDDSALLMNQHWVSVNDIGESKTVFIFRANSQLLISENGKVERGKWEYIDSNSLIIEQQEGCYLFKHGFLDDSVLALKVDGTNTYALFVNETKYGREINSLEELNRFLESRYLITNAISNPRKNLNIIIDPRIESCTLIDGRELVFYPTELNQKNTIEGCTVLINGEKPNDGFYKSSSRRYEIVDGILKKDYYIIDIKQSNGVTIEFDGYKDFGLSKGSRAWVNDSPAPNGKYSVGFLQSVTVRNGVVV